jgi:hypothetical protein
MELHDLIQTPIQRDVIVELSADGARIRFYEPGAISIADSTRIEQLNAARTLHARGLLNEHDIGEFSLNSRGRLLAERGLDEVGPLSADEAMTLLGGVQQRNLFDGNYAPFRSSDYGYNEPSDSDREAGYTEGFEAGAAAVAEWIIDVLARV